MLLGGSFLSSSPSAGQPWQDAAAKPPLNHQYTPHYPGPLDYPRVGGGSDGQHSPLLSHPAPNCHSSPRGGSRSQGKAAQNLPSFEEQEDSGLGPGPLDLSSLLEGAGLERSLLAAVDGLGRMGLGGAQPPLPEKKRVSEGEQSLGSRSPSLSGFSSPNSGSTVSIPFPNTLPDFSARVLSASSPLPGERGPSRCAALLPPAGPEGRSVPQLPSGPRPNQCSRLLLSTCAEYTGRESH